MANHSNNKNQKNGHDQNGHHDLIVQKNSSILVGCTNKWIYFLEKIVLVYCTKGFSDFYAAGITLIFEILQIFVAMGNGRCHFDFFFLVFEKTYHIFTCLMQ